MFCEEHITRLTAVYIKGIRQMGRCSQFQFHSLTHSHRHFQATGQNGIVFRRPRRYFSSKKKYHKRIAKGYMWDMDEKLKDENSTSTSDLASETNSLLILINEKLPIFTRHFTLSHLDSNFYPSISTHIFLRLSEDRKMFNFNFGS